MMDNDSFVSYLALVGGGIIVAFVMFVMYVLVVVTFS